MNNITKLKLIAQALNDPRLQKLAQQVKRNFDLAKALRVAPQYWRNLNLQKYQEAIKSILKTSAEPNSEEFINVVYDYQMKSPNITTKDGILGNETFSAMVSTNSSIFKDVKLDSVKPSSGTPGAGGSRTTPKAALPFDPRGKTAKEIADFATQMGFVNLRDHGVSTKNYPYVVPELLRLIQALNAEGVKLTYVSEAWPVTQMHRDPNHWNGRAMDFVLSNPKQSQLASKICQQLGFNVINEYTRTTTYTSGRHIHVDLGSTPSVTDKNKYLAWERLDKSTTV